MYKKSIEVPIYASLLKLLYLNCYLRSKLFGFLMVFFNFRINILGGLSDFGLLMANFLVTRGAKKIVLVSSSGVRTGFQSLFMRRWKEKFVEVAVIEYDTTKPEETEALLKEANIIGPVAGIFHVDSVLHSVSATDLTATDFRTAFDQKAASVKNLDTASQKLCPKLKHFLVWSSGTSGHGTAGQADHGYSDSAIGKISEARQAAGYPSVIYFYNFYRNTISVSCL